MLHAENKKMSQKNFQLIFCYVYQRVRPYDTLAEYRLAGGWPTINGSSAGGSNQSQNSGGSSNTGGGSNSGGGSNTSSDEGGGGFDMGGGE